MIVATNRGALTSRIIKIKPLLLLLALVSQLLAATSPSIATQASSSSYLNDYFSTAKYALNKLQQSLTIAAPAPTQALAGGGQQSLETQAKQVNDNVNDNKIAADKSTEATATRTQFASEQASPSTTETSRASEPDKSEFVRVDTSSSQLQKETLTSTEAATATATVAEDSTIVVSAAAAAADEQPATEESADALGRPAEDGPSLVVVESATGKIDEQQAAVNRQSAAAEEIIKETELNAVAAVDLSIGFGNDLNNLFSGGLDKEPCYDEYGNPRFCEPEFENVASERPVEVSSECGQPASRFCTASAPSSSSSSSSSSSAATTSESQIRNCHICDQQQAKKRHPASYLTDLNQAATPTCWVSAPIPATSGHSLAAGGNATLQPADDPRGKPIRADNVSLVLNLDKRYEILYVSLQFCSLKPDSLSIHKSNDFGHSWQPYQFYSSDCARLYNRQQQPWPPLSQSASQSPSAMKAAGEASCANVSSSGSSPTRVAFSTLDGARVGASLDKSPALQDWISATNIKITLDRHQAAWIQSTHHHHLHHHNHHHQQQQQQQQQLSARSSHSPPDKSSTTTTNTMPSAANQTTPAAAGDTIISTESSQQLTNPSGDTFNYAISDLVVGARCKCNGHASRCIHGKEGRLQCDCRHNTAGRDCERCAPLHADRPWARATPTEANICQACNCNGHSRKCRFDAELYRLSGKRSGGVCLQCKDNTDGRHCHYCREGHTRDHSKPMSDKEACKPCDCHPIGSLGRVCNQTTGQCPCKEGVTGLLCNRCAPNYQQSSSQSEPCIRIPPPEVSNEINNELLVVTESATNEDEQPFVDQVSGDSSSSNNNNNNSDDDTPTIFQEQPPAAPAPQLKQHQQLTSRAPPGGLDSRWPVDQSEEGGADYWRHQTDLIATEDEDARVPPPPPAPVATNNNGYSRPNHHQYWPPSTGGAPVARKRAGYYVGGDGRYHRVAAANRQHHSQFSSSRDPIDALNSADEDEIEPVDQLPVVSRARDNSDYLYRGGYDYATPPRQRQSYQRHHQQQQYAGAHYRPPRPLDQMPPPLQAVANLSPDEDPGDETNAAMGQYAGAHQVSSSSSSVYDDSNQIGGETHHRRPAHHQKSPSSSPLAGQTRRPLMAAVAGGGTSSPPNTFSSLINNNNVHPNVNNIIGSQQCGDCQSNMPRRLKAAKFCELEFAIRCSILNKHVAEDWTKLDIEVQDIFKSPMGAEQQSLARIANQQQATGSGAGEMLTMQQDAPVAQLDTSAPPTTSTSNKTNSADTNDIVPQHRLKVGTVQTIWVPTEDLACKCLRLKRGSTYLLMGTIDAKENSVNSLQLDRHGVALQWNSGVQSRILKLQRKYARGSLCV